jgi:hypothetical protein
MKRIEGWYQPMLQVVDYFADEQKYSDEW